MTTLHMEVDTCRGAQSKMVSVHGDLMSALNAIQSQVNNTVGSAWQGGSATDFQGRFQELYGQIKNQLDALEQLSTNLQTEITQWEQMSQKLG